MAVDQLSYQLANPNRLDVKHTRPIPNIGAKVKVIDDMGFNKEELRKLIGYSDILTVSEINPIVIGNGDTGYHWEYEIYTEEFGDDVMLLGWHYVIITN